jgi:Flp pilus assembly protein TadG
MALLLKDNRKGQVLVIVAIIIIVLMGVAALAIDVGRAYGVKAKLNAAVDVAAISAGRVVGKGAARVKSQAQEVFSANYPAGLLGSTVSVPETSATHNADGSWTIVVTASAQLPTSFAAVIGKQDLDVRASATTTVRTLDMILVLDTSGSLNEPPTTPALLRTAARDFITRFDPDSDRIGLVRYASGAITDVPITSTKGYNTSMIDSAIASLEVKGSTASEDALRIAKKQLDSIPADSRNSLRVIVLFTDGAPNTIAGNFLSGGGIANLYSEIENMEGKATRLYQTNEQENELVKSPFSEDTLPDTDFTGSVNLRSDLKPPTRIFIPSGTSITNTKCNVNRAARNMLENVAHAARSESDPIRIFTIGLGRRLWDLEVTGCDYDKHKESGENILRRLANVESADTYNKSQKTGMYIHAEDGSQLNAAFQRVANQILRLSK